MEKILTEAEIKSLRNKGVITKSEIALQNGDLFVAENVLTKERRIFSMPSGMDESKKQLLKG